MKDYYAILGVKENADDKTIKKAYHTLCKLYHPDKGGDKEKMQLVNEAYNTLKNKSLRKKYDSIRKPKTPPPQSHKQNIDSVKAYILHTDGKHEEKKFSRSQITFDLNKYIDNYGILYIYRNMENKNIAVKKSLWLNLDKYINRPDSMVKYITINFNGIICSGKIAIKYIPFDSINYINDENTIFILKNDLGITFYKSFEELKIASFNKFNTYNRYKDTTSPNITPKSKKNKNLKIPWVPIYWIFMAILTVAIIVGAFIGTDPKEPEHPVTASVQNTSYTAMPTTIPTILPTATPYLEPYPIPMHGTTRYAYGQGRAISEISFLTNASIGKYCFIKAVNVSSSKIMQTAFIHTGKEFTMRLPIGTYRVYFASGENWYGEEYLFGTSGTYSECDTVFTLTEYEGYTVTLYGVSNGNMSTENVSYEEFKNSGI